MTLSDQTQAILLLTTYFNKPSAADPKPLTPTEWGRFAEWLHHRGQTPRDLLFGDPKSLLADWDNPKITRERLAQLLDRGAAMAFATEKWLRGGLWVLTRSDQDYPARLRQHLRGQAPPVLFGCGNKALLSAGGLAVTGSRKVGDADINYSRVLGQRAAAAGASIISGGAKGVDETAMLAALHCEGTAVGVLADSLLRACASSKYRDFLARNGLVLVSSFYPEAGFNVGNAMQRNKYIYCLADTGIAVHSGTSGGTWNGAQEVLKKRWVPLWVRPTEDSDSGNSELLKMGAHPAPRHVDDIDLSVLCKPPASGQVAPATPATEAHLEHVKLRDQGLEADTSNAPPDGSRSDAEKAPIKTPGPAQSMMHDLSEISFFQVFVAKAQPLCAAEPRTAEQLAEELALNRSQVNEWAKQAVAENKLSKLTRPVRYGTPNYEQAALPLVWPT